MLLVLHRANGRGGFGSQTAADPSGDPRKALEKQTVGTVTASHEMLSLQALSSRHCKEGLPGPRGESVPQNGRVHLHSTDWGGGSLRMQTASLLPFGPEAPRTIGEHFEILEKQAFGRGHP